MKFVTSQMHFIVNVISLINEVCDIADLFIVNIVSLINEVTKYIFNCAFSLQDQPR